MWSQGVLNKTASGIVVCAPAACLDCLFLFKPVLKYVLLEKVACYTIVSYRVVPFVWDKLSGWVEEVQASILR